ncbi:MAG: prepilin-type N-terminal cleavage/methylation domain-containing protein [bacterium]
MLKFIKENNKGFTLVEVLVGSSIIAVAIFALMNAYTTFLKAEASSAKTVEATYLLEEGVEAARFMRDSSYADNLVGSLGTSSVNYLVLVASSTAPYYVWQATSTARIEDGLFTRTIKLDDVKRDAVSSDISSTGNYDVGTKKVTVTVSWLKNGATTSKTASTYLTDIYNN